MKCDIFNIWEDLRTDLRNYVGKRVYNEHDVDDIMQTILIKVITYCEKKNDVRYIKAWLYRIAQHTIFDFHKKPRKTTLVDLEQLHLFVPDEYDENVFVWLDKFINGLPIDYSTPLRLSDIEGLPQKSIAAHLGLTLSATKSRILRARKKVRAKFDECGEVEYSENQMWRFTITKSCCLS
ncbi:sigma-70 family RNA polymerase sigma factor [Flagellimonas crocea]|uniref:sigma-70 family RNA polymerase sigma factor n=1 Tax=Flagellimonas crocea TaxID=3067311 RepID=UPI00296F795E|nr:sigma-70 family RNA polymerase sigma factor [Muricauda sp. DH64]